MLAFLNTFQNIQNLGFITKGNPNNYTTSTPLLLAGKSFLQTDKKENVLFNIHLKLYSLVEGIRLKTLGSLHLLSW